MPCATGTKNPEKTVSWVDIISRNLCFRFYSSMAHAGDPPAALTEDSYSQSHRNSGASFSQNGGLLVMNNPKCFFEVSADGENIGRMVFELREDLVPKTVENFKKLCEGFDGKCFKTSIFHRIIPGFMCQVRRGPLVAAPGEGGSWWAGPHVEYVLHRGQWYMESFTITMS